MNLRKVKIFEPLQANKATKIVGGEASGIVNWNDLKYPQIYEKYKQLLSVFWTPFEINMTADIKQWGQLSEKEQESFLRINSLLAILDSVQPAYINKIADYITDPSIKHCLYVIGQQEVIHNHSYSYILSSLVPLKVQNSTFEEGRTDEMILKRNKYIMDAYNEFNENPTLENLCKTLVYSTILEGINFYSGFAFFYNLARYQKMVKTSTMISYINRDEMLHSDFIATVLRAILGENPEIDEDGKFSEFVYEAIGKAVELEIEWSEHVLSGLEGIDLYEMKQYIQYLGNKRLRVLGLDDLYEAEENVMPWINVFGDNSLGNSKSDFFENKSREYTKATDDNGFDEL